jgi:hypothetical protein
VKASGGEGWADPGSATVLPGDRILVGGDVGVANVVLGPGEAHETELSPDTWFSVSTAFLAAYNPDGTLEWAQLLCYDGESYVFGLAATPEGAFAATGYFNGTVDFLPRTPYETTLDGLGYSDDVYLAVLGPAREPEWITRDGGVSREWGIDVAFLADGSLAAGGMYMYGAWFGDDEVFLDGASDEVYYTEGWIAVYERCGALRWAQRLAGPSSEQVSYVVPLRDGPFLVAGLFGSTVTLGEGTPSEVTVSGDDDIFVARYTP